MTRSLHVDVAILGDGVGAWAAAAVLALAGARVSVIGPAGPRSRDVGEYLPPEGLTALSALGLGHLLRSSAHLESAGILSRWGSASVTRQSNLLWPGGRAHCVDRVVLRNDLVSAARRAGAISRTTKSRALVSCEDGIWQIQADGSNVLAPIALDATGRHAALSRAAGAVMQRYDDLVALSARLDCRTLADTMFRVESLQDGWCYVAPQDGGKCMVVWLGDACDLPNRNDDRAQAAFERFRVAGFAADLPGLARMQWSETPIVAWTQRTMPSAGAGWAAIGDAAMAFDPLASAGLTKLFLDIRVVSDLIWDGRSDFGCLLSMRREMLARYRDELDSAYATERRFCSSPFWRRRHS